MLADLTSIYIVSKKATQGLSSDDFSSGKGMIGTGPFRFVKFQRDDRIELERNNDYWGKKPAWSKVILRFIPNDATRLAALLAGDVQAIENVPTPDLAKVRADKNLSFYSKVSHRVIYLYPDTRREKSPFVTDKDGKPLDKNPLMDVRARRALSIAINRDAIRDRIMEGLSEPTVNLVPAALFGHNPNLKPPKYDPEAAKKLLAEAGYPNGFGLTLHTPNNRYVNDEKNRANHRPDVVAHRHRHQGRRGADVGIFGTRRQGRILDRLAGLGRADRRSVVAIAGIGGLR